MQRFFAVMSLGCVFAATSTIVTAQAPPEAIGFVNFSQALQTVEEAKREIETVSSFRDQKQQEADSRFTELKRFRDDLAARAASLNAEALVASERELEEKETALKRFQEETQKEIDTRRDELLRKYGQKLQTVMNEYCEQNGYAVLFLLDQAEYAYVDPDLDITSEIVDLYNQRHPAP